MKRLGILIFAVALVLAVAGLFVVSASVLLLIFAGVLFGLFLNGLSRWIAGRTPLAYRWAYLLVLVLLLAAVAGGAYYMGSRVAKQTAQLSKELRSAGEKVSERVKQYEWAPDLSQVKKTIQGRTGIASQVTNAVGALLWGITGALVIFFVGAYVAYDPDLYEKGIIRLVPQERRPRATDVLRQLRSSLGRWIVGRILSMAIIGVFTAIGLSLLGVPLPITLGVLAALLTFVPNLGPILAAIPQALLAFQVGASTVLWVILLNVVLQGVESYLVTPMIQQYEVSLPPAVTISVQLLFAVIFGAVGLLVAAPLTVMTMVIVQMLYIEDRLGDRQAADGGGG